MSKAFVLLLVLMTLAPAVFAQNANISVSGENAKEKAPAGSVVRGRAFYEDTGRPVRRTPIGLLDIEELSKESENFSGYSIGSFPGIASHFVLTDDNGEFEIKNVKAGRYFPVVQAPNVLNSESINRFFGKNQTLSFSKLADYFDEIRVDGINPIQVLVPVKRGGAIGGRILYADGSPVAGVRVELFRQPADPLDKDPVTVQETETDDRGVYRFTELPPGDYYIKTIEPAVHSGNGRDEDSLRNFTRESELVLFFPDVSEIKKAGVIKIGWGQEQSRIDIIIPDRRLFKISGTVIAKDTQQPVGKAALTFQKIAEPGGARLFEDSNKIVSDDQGKWLFKDLPSGLYRLKASASASENKALLADSIKEIEIEKTDLENVLIELPPGATVAGKVTVEENQELPQFLKIYFVDDKQVILKSAGYYNYQRKEKGSPPNTLWEFSQGGFSAGDYSIRLWVEGDFYVKSIRAGKTDLTGSKLELKEAENVDNIEIVLGTDVSTFRGTLLENKGNPAKVVSILLIPIDAEKQKGENLYFFGHTNVRGEFIIKAAPGEYFITFPENKPPTSESEEVSEEERIKNLTENASKITLKPNETTTVQLKLPD